MSSSSSSRKPRKPANVSNVMYTNAVYFPNYRIYKGDTPGQLNYACISLVYYAFANVAQDGGVFVGATTPGGRRAPANTGSQLSDEWADAGVPCDGVKGGLGSLMHLKGEHPHLQVVLSIGGANSAEAFPFVAANPLLRDNFARSAAGLVDASGLDGIDGSVARPPRESPR